MDNTGRGKKIKHLEIRYKRNKNSVGREMTCIYAFVRVRLRVCVVFAD
jgi:hypothetical protein